MGNLLHFIVVVNCPLTENYMFYFRPDNLFFGSTYRRARYYKCDCVLRQFRPKLKTK